MRYLFLDLKVRNGEYEYSCTSVHQLEKGMHARAFAERYAKTFYGDGDYEGEETFGKGVYYFNGCEVAVSVYNYKVISEEHYEVLKQYI